MTENFDHYISRNIRAFYKRKLPALLVFLFFLLMLWIIFPLGDILSPKKITAATMIESLSESDYSYISTKFENLTFTGYTTKRFGSIDGYFYYGKKDNQLFIVLLSPNSCEQGLPSIKSTSVICRIVKGKSSYDNLLENLANDLDWTKEGITSQLPNCYFSEPDFNPLMNTLLFTTYFACFLYSILSLLCALLFIQKPVFSPACQNLIIYGNPKEILDEAEEELATLPQLATEDMFITEHYFILTSPYGNAIVPIQEIIWIYKYSTLHKFFSYHFSISYTLHINGNKHFFIQCPKNTKSDIDGIIDYLSEANHSILVGFSEENRLKVQKQLLKPFHFEKWTAFLKKRK